MYLVDTDVVSASAPSKAATPRAMIRWMDDHSADLFLSSVSVAEICAGITKLQREGADRRADTLEAWLDTLLHLYAARVLAFDVEAARIAGALLDRARSHAPGFADVAIAATARRHGLTILTRNLRHFEPLCVPCLDPFRALPPG